MQIELSELESKFLLTAIENQGIKGVQMAEVVVALTKKLAPQAEPPKA